MWRMYSIARRRYYILNTGGKQRILESPNCPRHLRKASVYVSLQCFQLHTIAFWVEKRPQNVWTSDARLTYERKFEACLCLFRRHCNILANGRLTHWPRLPSSDVVKRLWHDIKPAEMWVFHQLLSFSWSCHLVCAPPSIDTNMWSYTWVSTPHKCDGTSVVFGFLWRISSLLAKLRPCCAVVNRKLCKVSGRPFTD